MERSFDDDEFEALLRGREVDPTLAPVARLLGNMRDELVQPVPDEVADAHLAAILAAAPPAPGVQVPAPSATWSRSSQSHAGRSHSGRRRHHSQRVAAFAACVSMTLAYGGLAAAGALPGGNVATHLGGWF